jgi:SRSO17 transposase
MRWNPFGKTWMRNRLILLSQKVAGFGSKTWVTVGDSGISMGGVGMDLGSTASSESRFSTYVEGLVSVIGHSDQAGPLRDYCVGLLMPGDRKSVEPMAAITAPERNAAQHQSLLHFVADAPWSDERVLTKVREMVQPAIERGGPIEAWIIDDTGFPKKGEHSVGVARQYCGQLGKQDNCQAAVSLSIAYRLYLTEEWAADAARRKKARVPKDIEFQTKPEIALEQIRAACEAGIARGVVLMDAGYGANTELRTGISALGLRYVAGILPQTKVWAATTALCRAKQKSRRRRPPKRARHDAELQRISVKDLALSLPKRAWPRSGGAKARPTGCPRALPECGCARRRATTSWPRAGRKNGF